MEELDDYPFEYWKRAKNKMDGISRIKDITLKIAYHENRIAMHKSVVEKLRKQKSILMNKEWVKDDRR